MLLGNALYKINILLRRVAIKHHFSRSGLAQRQGFHAAVEAGLYPGLYRAEQIRRHRLEQPGEPLSQTAKRLQQVVRVDSELLLDCRRH